MELELTCLFQVKNRITRKECEISLKLTIKTKSRQRHLLVQSQQ